MTPVVTGYGDMLAIKTSDSSLKDLVNAFWARKAGIPVVELEVCLRRSSIPARSFSGESILDTMSKSTGFSATLHFFSASSHLLAHSAFEASVWPSELSPERNVSADIQWSQYPLRKTYI